jgi:hypothetical protein
MAMVQGRLCKHTTCLWKDKLGTSRRFTTNPGATASALSYHHKFLDYHSAVPNLVNVLLDRKSKAGRR